MNYTQLYAQTETNSLLCRSKNIIQIFVGGQIGDPAIKQISQTFAIESTKRSIKTAVFHCGQSGYDDLEPLVRIRKPENAEVFYACMSPAKASLLTEDYLVHDNPHPDLALCSKGSPAFPGIQDMADLPLFKIQNRIALRNCGYLDPLELDHYILNGRGYSGLAKALEMGREGIVAEIEKSGLRSQGGEAYPLAGKWRSCGGTAASDPYTICNALFSRRFFPGSGLLINSDPHAVLEGLLISACATGASHCLVCINKGDEISRVILENALLKMQANNLLGGNILDSHFSASIEIRELESSLVAGEESALLSALEGKQTIPFIRPPYPECSTLNGKPALVNDVETLADISAIFQKGPEWFSALGSGSEKGTRIVILTGDIVHPYVVEVPLGTTLADIIRFAGGGTGNGPVKAVQLGGPAGCFLTDLDTPFNFSSLDKSSRGMGLGIIEVYSRNSPLLEIIRNRMSFLHEQSCGKCVFCREGTLQMSAILEDILQGKGRKDDLERLLELAEYMKEGSICALGKNAANPVASSIELFPSEYQSRPGRTGISHD